jgi:hypothetical protein
MKNICTHKCTHINRDELTHTFPHEKEPHMCLNKRENTEINTHMSTNALAHIWGTRDENNGFQFG